MPGDGLPHERRLHHPGCLEKETGINPRETTADRIFDLDTVACVGCCTMAPVTVVDDKPQGQVEPTRVDGILLAFELEREDRDKEKSESS